MYFVFIGVNAILPTRSRRFLDGLAGSSYLRREDAAIVWYLAPWITSWLWVENDPRRRAIGPRSGAEKLSQLEVRLVRGSSPFAVNDGF